MNWKAFRNEVQYGFLFIADFNRAVHDHESADSFSSAKIKGRWVSVDNFLYLISLYATILIGFGLIYIWLDLHGLVVLMDGTEYMETGFLERLETGFYFSAVTLFLLGMEMSVLLE
ncbi:hypothetical protein [Cytobacillus firmus]|uniref:hypothetical protein n=1 Tax=Cytobacillus firmus TaxID=1399 RepID=UPI00351A3C45